MVYVLFEVGTVYLDVVFEMWSHKRNIACEEQMVAGRFICQVIYRIHEQERSKHRALRHTAFYDTFAGGVATQFHS